MENDSELNKNIERLNHNLERQLSLKYIILKGAIYGLGTAIGATVVAGILFSLLSSTFENAEEIPIISEIHRG